MPVYTSEALILRTYKLGEADRIVVFLTRDRGKKRGVAKGARRARSRFIGALEPMTRAGVAYYEREQRDLVRINYVEPQRSPLSGVGVGGGARARRLLRRADRRVGARGACRRAAVPAGVVGDRRDCRAACRSSRWRGTSSTGCCGCRASIRRSVRVCAPVAAGLEGGSEREAGAMMPPRDHVLCAATCAPAGGTRCRRRRACSSWPPRAAIAPDRLDGAAAEPSARRASSRRCTGGC